MNVGLQVTWPLLLDCNHLTSSFCTDGVVFRVFHIKPTTFISSCVRPNLVEISSVFHYIKRFTVVITPRPLSLSEAVPWQLLASLYNSNI